MAYKITEECIACGNCQAECPNGAITDGEVTSVIDPEKCTECVGINGKQKCVVVCPTEALEPDPAHKETKEQLLAKWNKLHQSSDAATVKSQTLQNENPLSSNLKQPEIKSLQSRSSDGTALGDMIAMGKYRPQAGTEKIGYFDPGTAPFRVNPGNKVGIMHGSMANVLIQTIKSAGIEQVRKVYGTAFDKTGDIAVDLAVKLGLSSVEGTAEFFNQLAKFYSWPRIFKVNFFPFVANFHFSENFFE